MTKATADAVRAIRRGQPVPLNQRESELLAISIKLQSQADGPPSTWCLFKSRLSDAALKVAGEMDFNISSNDLVDVVNLLHGSEYEEYEGDAVWPERRDYS